MCNDPNETQDQDQGQTLPEIPFDDYSDLVEEADAILEEVEESLW